MARHEKREVVELKAFSAHGDLVEAVQMSVADYYQSLHDLIDKNEYRAARGIAVIEGRVYGPSGKLDEEFRNLYAVSGAFTRGRAVFADGTVNED